MTESNGPQTGSTKGKRVRRGPLRPLSAVVLVVLAGVAVASSLITRNVVAGQERLILREQTAQAAAVFVSAFAGVQSSLQLLGEIARSDQDNPRMFANATRAVSATGTLGWLVTTQSGTSPRVTAAAGDGPAVGHSTRRKAPKRGTDVLATAERLLPGPGAPTHNPPAVPDAGPALVQDRLELAASSILISILVTFRSMMHTRSYGPL
jgi:hypothetical protein